MTAREACKEHLGRDVFLGAAGEKAARVPEFRFREPIDISRPRPGPTAEGVVAKASDELTAADLAEHPVWVPIDHRFDYFVPHRKRGPPRDPSLVRLVFQSAEGREYRGFGTTTRISVVAPVVLVPEGRVHLHFGRRTPSRDDLARAYSLLESSPERFFPVSFRADASPRHDAVRDVYEAFTYQARDGSIQQVR